jgi:hypothetical protein
MMTNDRTTLVVEDCVEYWRKTGVPRSAVAGMKEELEQHLQDAVAAGKSIESVVGPDVLEFAEEWAREYRPAGSVLRPVEGRGPAFLAMATGILVFVTLLGLAAWQGGGVEVCCPRRVYEQGPSLAPGVWVWIGVSLAVIALTVIGSVALFRGKLRIGAWVLTPAAALALLTPVHLIAATMLAGAAAWAFARARRAETPVPAP